MTLCKPSPLIHHIKLPNLTYPASQLNPSALAALQEFYTERDTRSKQFEDLKASAETEFDKSAPLSMDLFTEDWNASQFWYTDATATTLARHLLTNATADSAIAVVSAPSVYIALRNLLNTPPYANLKLKKVVLLEFDERFAVFKDEFAFYDFKEPFKLDASLKGVFDRVVVDPPFLSEDCQTKAAMTVRWLSREHEAPGLKLVLCTGERMEGLAHKLYARAGVKTTSFYPEHSKGLSNEFRCYANFECEDWKFEA